MTRKNSTITAKPKPASPAMAAASRANGAKSRGPITPEGKARSSMNALKHGCYVDAVLLVNEEPEPWANLLRDFIRQFNPIGNVELGLVEEMAVSHWRMRRYWFAEAATLDMEMLRQQPSLEARNKLLTEPQRVACAIAHFTAQPGQQTLQFYHRIETRLRRNYSRALADLLKIQQLRLQSQPEPVSNRQPAEADPTSVLPVQEINGETNPAKPQPPADQPLAASAASVFIGLHQWPDHSLPSPSVLPCYPGKIPCSISS